LLSNYRGGKETGEGDRKGVECPCEEKRGYYSFVGFYGDQERNVIPQCNLCFFWRRNGVGKRDQKHEEGEKGCLGILQRTRSAMILLIRRELRQPFLVERIILPSPADHGRSPPKKKGWPTERFADRGKKLTTISESGQSAKVETLKDGLVYVLKKARRAELKGEM